MLWHQVRNEGREQSGVWHPVRMKGGYHLTSRKDDFLERTKAAREERQLEEIRGKI
jgi:hypothetical protein